MSAYESIYFHYHNLDKLKAQLVATGFGALEIFKVPYKKHLKQHLIYTLL